MVRGRCSDQLARRGQPGAIWTAWRRHHGVDPLRNLRPIHRASDLPRQCAHSERKGPPAADHAHGRGVCGAGPGGPVAACSPRQHGRHAACQGPLCLLRRRARIRTHRPALHRSDQARHGRLARTQPQTDPPAGSPDPTHNVHAQRAGAHAATPRRRGQQPRPVSVDIDNASPSPPASAPASSATRCPRSTPSQRLHLWAVRRVDRIVVISSALRRWYLERGLPPERVLVAHDAAPAAAFDLEPRAAARQALDLAPDTPAGLLRGPSLRLERRGHAGCCRGQAASVRAGRHRRAACRRTSTGFASLPAAGATCGPRAIAHRPRRGATWPRPTWR